MLFDRHTQIADQRNRQMGAGSAVFLQGSAGDTSRQQEGHPR